MNDSTIIKQFGNIIKKFKILNHEWEMDGYGYIVHYGTENVVVITNHNRPMIANTDYLQSKIRDYGEAILETNEAIKLIKNEN